MVQTGHGRINQTADASVGTGVCIRLTADANVGSCAIFNDGVCKHCPWRPPISPAPRGRASPIAVDSDADECLGLTSVSDSIVPIEDANNDKDSRELVTLRTARSRYASSLGYTNSAQGDVPELSVAIVSE